MERSQATAWSLLHFLPYLHVQRKQEAEVPNPHITCPLKEMRLECQSNGLCSRSKLAHEKWRPIVSQGKVEQFIAGEEREYPEGFCESFSKLLRCEVHTEKIRSFVEIYSGPNAPLSRAMAAEYGGEVD